MEISEYLCKVYRYRKNNPEQRVGQAYFNVLVKVREDLADSVYGTEIDPYYDNRNLPRFLAWVGENWETDARVHGSKD